jgi:hypothetical protein
MAVPPKPRLGLTTDTARQTAAFRWSTALVATPGLALVLPPWARTPTITAPPRAWRWVTASCASDPTMDADQGTPAEPMTKPTPSTPAELAAMQRSDEVCLLHGFDLSTKARAVYLFSEELGLSLQEATTQVAQSAWLWP